MVYTSKRARCTKMNLHLKYQQRVDESTSIKVYKVFFFTSINFALDISPHLASSVCVYNLNKVFSKFLYSIRSSSSFKPLEID